MTMETFSCTWLTDKLKLPDDRDCFEIELNQVKYLFKLHEPIDKSHRYDVSLVIIDPTGSLSGNYDTTYFGIMNSSLPEDFRGYFSRIMKNIAFI